MHSSPVKPLDTDLARVARCFHALSDETRVRVVEMLATGEKCVCDLQDAVGAAQSRLSFHLKVLREAGLTVDRRQGRWVYYSLRPETLEEMAAYLRKRHSAGRAAATRRGSESIGRFSMNRSTR